MSNTKCGGPAFPVEYAENRGMTLRDWFAGEALAALIPEYGLYDDVARNAYKIADAMLVEREK